MSFVVRQRLREAQERQEAERERLSQQASVQAQQEQAQQSTLSVVATQDIKPSQNVATFARETGLPVSVVSKRADLLDQEQRRTQVFETLRRAPILSKVVANPNMAATLQESLDQLAEFEEKNSVRLSVRQAGNFFHDQAKAQMARMSVGSDPIRRARDEDRGLIERLEYEAVRLLIGEGAPRVLGAGQKAAAAASGVVQVPEMMTAIVGGLERGVRRPVGRALEETGIPGLQQVGQLIVSTTELQAPIFDALSEELTALRETLQPEEMDYLDKVAQGVGQFAAQLAVFVATGGLPAFAAAFAMGGGQQELRMREQGIDSSKHGLALLGGGAATAWTEITRFNRFMKILPPSARQRVSSAFAGSIGKAAQRNVTRIAGTVAREAAEEATQEAIENTLQNAVAKFTYEPDAEIFEGFVESLTVGGGVGAVVAAMLEVVLPGRLRDVETDTTKKGIEEMRDVVQAAVATTQHKQDVEEYINTATENETVGLDADGVNELFQDDPEGTRAMLEALGVSEAQIQRALEGDDILVAVSKLATMEDQGQFDQLVDIARTRPEAKTPREARRDAEEGLGPELTEQLNQILDDNVALETDERIEQNVRDQLLRAGESRDVANAGGLIWSRVFRMLEMRGVDTAALYEQLGLQVVGPGREPPAAPTPEPTELEQAKRAGYEGQDTGEAREWIRARDKGLDMSTEARIDRAEDMRFDTKRVFYRGSGADETTLRVSRGHEARTIGVSLSPSNETASFYANLAGGDNANVAAYYVKKGDFIDIDDLLELAQRQLDPEGTSGDEWIERATDEYLTQLAKDNGYIGSYFNDGGIEDYRVFDPTNIRSVNAAFDPDYADEPTLLAQAKRVGYEGEDTGEAAEWIRARDKGLDMSTEARMRRARDMGFDTDTVLYHGTGRLGNFEEGFDPALSGQGNDQYGSGFYFTTDPAEASMYAGGQAGQGSAGVIPAYTKIKNPIVIDGNKQRSLRDINASFTEEQVYQIMKRNPDIYDLEKSPIGDWVDIYSEGQVTDKMLRDVAKNYAGPGRLQMIEGDLFRNNSGAFRRAVNEVTGIDGVIVKFDGREHRIAWFPEQIRSVNAAFDPDFADEPTLLAQTAADLQRTPVRMDGTGPGGRVLNWDFATFLTDRHMQTYGRVLDPSDPDDYDTILQSLLQDYEEQTAQEDTGDAWYTDDINEAIELTSQIYPELSEPEFRDLFLTVTALLSPRQKPAANWENAILALRSWAETGRLELAKPNGKQFGVEAQRTSLELFQYMIDTMGLAEATKWVQTKHTGREMAEIRMQSGIYRKDAPSDKAKDYLPSETNLTEAKLGIYMFGPKVGDFMQNSVGIDQSAVTVDMWAARTYNRYIGRLMDVAPKLAEAKQIQSDVRGRSERQHITKLFREAAQQVGIDPSAMQAALWYFEQRLYRVHGIKSDSQNFSDAARKSLTQRGIDVFTGRDRQAEGRDVGAGATELAQEEDGVGPERAGDGGGRLPSGRLARLEGAPTVRAATGPIPRIVEVADKYARDNGIPAGRQAQYAEVDEQRAERIAQAYAEMEHNPSDPAVKEAYDDLVRQTIAQYEALVEAGYQFYFIDINSDAGVEYVASPYNAMRELRADQRMGVFPTNEGFGTLDVDVNDNPLLATTQYQWPFGSPDGELRPVTANDLFRAVHDALGHGLEGAGFRARGEENAWQAHVRLYTGPAVAAMTSETRGQNSWLNYGPYGEANRTAKTEDTIFADQKTGIMPEWTWTEGRVPDMRPVVVDQELGAPGERGPRGLTRVPGPLGTGTVLGSVPTLVKLTEAKDKTTFLHESAHVFLEVFAALEDTNPEIAAEMAPVREWLGWEKGKPLTVEMHEKFAGLDGFEGYLSTGKAPAPELRSVFEQFRNWFVKVYEKLRGRELKIDQRARDFFDRMLATEQEISNAERSYHDVLTDTMRGLMTPEQVEKHSKLAERAGRVARDRIFKKHLEQIMRRDRKTYKEAKRRIEEDVRAKLEDLPIFRALAELADEKSPVVLNRAVTEEIVGPDNMAPLEPYVSEEGVDPEGFALSMGFASADEMFQEIASNPDFDIAVEYETRRRLDDLEDDLLVNPDRAEQEAIEATFNDAQVRKLEVERDALAQRALQEPIPLLAIRRRARDVIDNTPIDEVIKPGRYAMQAQSLHKKAVKAAAKGQFDVALRLTHQAMMQHELARYAYKARSEIEKINRFLARFGRTRKLDPKRIAPEFIDPIRTLMAMPGAVDQTAARSVLVQFEALKAQENIMLELPVEIFTQENLPDRRKMTLQQFRSFRDGVKSLHKNGREQSDVEKAKRAARNQAMADVVIAAWGKRKLKEPTRAPKLLERLMSGLAYFDSLLIRLPFLAEILQNGRDGPLYDILWRDIAVAYNRTEGRHFRQIDQLTEILNKHNITARELNRLINEPLLDRNPIHKEKLFVILLNMGNAGNIQRISDDPSLPDALRGDPQAILQLLERRLEKRHFDAAQEIWDLLEQDRDDLGVVHQRRTGVIPTWVEPQELVTKYGTYKGGYYPIKYRPGVVSNSDIKEREVENLFAEFSGGGVSKAQTRNGMVQTRVESQQREMSWDFNNIISHMRDTAVMIEMSEAIDNAWSVISSSAFKRALEQTWGIQYQKPLENIIKRTAADATIYETEDSQPYNKIMRIARINASIAILGLRIPTALLAPVSYFQTVFPRYGFKVVARGLIEWFGRYNARFVKSKQTMEELSPFMAERARLINREATDIAKRQVFSGKWSAVQGSGYVPMAVAEKHTVGGPLWWGVYRTAKLKGLSDPQAIADADTAIATTQGGGRIMDQSIIQGASSEFHRALTFMWGFVSGYYGVVRTDLAGAETGLRKTAQLVKHFVVLNTFAAILENLIRDPTALFDEDDEEATFLFNVLKTMGRNMLIVPGASAVFSRYYNAPQLEQLSKDTQQTFNYGAKTLEDYFENGEVDGEMAWKTARRALETAGFALGVPGTLQAGQVIDVLEQLEEEDEDPSFETFYRALVAGPKDDS